MNKLEHVFFLWLQSVWQLKKGDDFLSSALCTGSFWLWPKWRSVCPVQGCSSFLQKGRHPPDCQHGGWHLVAGLSLWEQQQSGRAHPFTAATWKVVFFLLIIPECHFNKILFLFQPCLIWLLTGELHYSGPEPCSGLGKLNDQVRSQCLSINAPHLKRIKIF